MDLQSNNVFDIKAEDTQPILKSITCDSAECQYLVDTWAEGRDSQIVVEIVRKKIRRGTAIKAPGHLRCLRESKTFTRQDRSNARRTVRLGSQHRLGTHGQASR